MPTTSHSRVLGVDFSGGADAGRKIWVCESTLAFEGLTVRNCQPASDLPGASVERAGCLPALRTWILSAPCAAGVDFPVGLPQALVAAADWESFVSTFALRYPDAAAFRNACRAAAQGKELRRRTDRESRTPFSPYNLRLYRQTYYGIAQVAAPLIAGGRVRGLPMQAPDRGASWLLEVCPASLLKQRGLYRPYKGRGDGARRQRRAILRAVTRDESLRIDRSIVRAIEADPEGDALDSVLAAVAAARAVRAQGRVDAMHDEYRLEGYVWS